MNKLNTVIKITISVIQKEHIGTFETIDKKISVLSREKEFDATAKDAKSAFNVMYSEMKQEASDMQNEYINTLMDKEAQQEEVK